jgi:hypothetical protein
MSIRSGVCRALRNQCGHATIVLSAVISLLLGAAGVAVDANRVYQSKHQLRTAAEAAALAGASEMRRERRVDIVAAARAGSAMNGFTHGDGTSVDIFHPPITGLYRGNPRYVEAQITRRTPTYFMRLLLAREGISSSARAVAGPGADGRHCVYVLDPTAADAFNSRNGSTFDASCGVMVNSTHANAMQAANGTRVQATDVSITGGYRSDRRSLISARPTTDAPAEPDPLAYLQTPTVGDCDHTGWTRASGTHTLAPGVYCGGITLRNSARASMQPGLYVVRGGGVKTQGRAHLTGSGVTFYLTGDAGYPYEPVHFARTTQTRLGAPTGGDYAGILFFQDRTMNPAETNRLESRAKSHFEGALYFPTQILRLEGTTTLAARYTLVVSRLLQVDGAANVRIRNDYSRLAGGSPIKKLSLLE